jgi:HK97 family phage major capsid protein
MQTEASMLLEKSTKLFEEAKSILQNPESGAEAVEKADKMVEEAKGLRTRAAKLDEINQEADELTKQREAEQDRKRREDESKTRTGSDDAPNMDFSQFIKALVVDHRSKGRITDPRLKSFFDPEAEKALDGAGRQSQKDLAEATGASGGYLVPTEALSQIMAVAAPMTVVRQRATVIPMGRRQITMPVLDQTGTTQGDANFFGGIEVFWQEEASQKSKSEPTWRQASLTAHELVGYTIASDALLEDAETSLAAWLSGPLGFPGAIAWAEDYAFLRGNGAGQPQGVLNAPAALTTARTTAGDIKYDDLVDMDAKFYGMNPVWVASQSAKKELMLMNGPDGNPSYLWGNATQGVPPTLLGYPIKFIDKLPALGTRGDIMLCDFTYYMIGDRRATTVESSIHANFRNNQTAFRAVHRVDGQPWLSAPITYQDGQTQVSPFVVLGDAAS